MASRYLVATGNWNSTSVWSTTVGGASGASVPVLADDVYIPSNTAYTVTLTGTVKINTLNQSGIANTPSTIATAGYNIYLYGGVNQASNITISGGGIVVGWYNTSWKYREAIKVAHGQVNANQTNFPVWLKLAQMSAGFFTNVRSDGGDIRITEANGVTEVAREIVAINTTSSTGEVHFLANSLSSTVDTIFYVYYGNAAATDYAVTATYGRNAVWAGYVAVWHLNGTTDSTGNGHTITLATGNSVVAGKLTSGITTVNADSNGIGFSAISWAANTGFTFEIWANVTAWSTTGQFTLLGDGSNSNPTFINSRQNNAGIQFNLGGTSLISQFGAPPSWSLNTWTYITATADTTAYASNWDGTNYDATTSANTFAAFTSNALAKGNYGSVNDATYSEARIQSVRSTNDYFVTTHNNQNSPSTFYTMGAQEQNNTVISSGQIIDIQSIGNITSITI